MIDNREYQRMIKGELYSAANNQALSNLAEKGRLLNESYNKLSRQNKAQRSEVLKKMLGSLGKNPTIESPFYIDYGVNIHIGDNFYANFDCMFLDSDIITIGDDVMMGPSVRIYAATHPIDPDVRTRGLELTAPVTIGDKCWIGGSVVIVPGVEIGANTIIGAGSVVTKNIPANVIAAGNPCRVIRPIDENDRQYWHQLERDYYQ